MWRWIQNFVLWGGVVTSLLAQYPADCDRRKACIYNALHQTVTFGKGAQYVEVETSEALDTIRRALTVEFWAKIERQPGTRQFLAGVWGPHRNANDDGNDVWVLYIDRQDQLVFAVHPGIVPGPADYTVVSVAADTLYDRWHHIAAVFDGAQQEVRLYIDGQRRAVQRNAQYPATRLHIPEQRFPLLIGNSNAFSDASYHRTFKGWMDEIRIWSVALSDTQIRCGKDRSLNGNELGLQLYFRCNEEPTVLELCDATGNNHVGRLRSGARCERSDRRRSYTNWTDLPVPFRDTLFCESTRSYIFTVQDTSACGGRARLRVVGPDRNYFTVRPTGWFPLNPGIPVRCTLTVNTQVIGSIRAELRIIPDNRCARYIRIPLELERETQLRYDTNRLWFDTLYAYCRQERWRELDLRICNQTDRTGTPRTLTLQQLVTGMPQVFEIVAPKPPIRLAPGECTVVRVRFYSRDSTQTYFDTLKVYSDDACAPLSTVVLEGSVQEVLELVNNQGRLDTLRFEPTCPNMVSRPILYTWQNLLSEPLQIDTIVMPPFIVGRTFRFPVTLLPATGYRPNYFRFRPLQPGWVFDSIIFRMRVGPCTIDRVVYVQGRGLDSDLRFENLVADTLDFGTVVIGQQRQQLVSIRNNSVDPLNLAFYLEQGEAFRLPQSAASLPPGGATTVPVVFRPTQSKMYIDRFCYFEKRCYAVGCIYVRGQGIEQTLSFQPAEVRIEDVLGCSSRTATLRLTNITTEGVMLRNIRFRDPNGRFVVEIPSPLPVQKMLPPGEQWELRFRYRPNDLTQDRADRAYLEFEAAGQSWIIQIVGNSVVPKLYVTPLTVYGIVEVGDQQEQTLIVQNISPVPVQVDSIVVPAGFATVDVQPPLPVTLQPRDSIVLRVAFQPSAPQRYQGKIRVFSSSPCPIPPTEGELQGEGTLVELEAPVSVMHFSYVRPCECEQRILPLVNGSLVNSAVVDSIWIDATGIVADAAPQYFRWRSKFSPDGRVPYTIPPQTNDTLIVTYCPRALAIDTLLIHTARLHIKAHAPGWSVQYDVYLSGKQVMMFAPDRTMVWFVDTPVDTILVPEELKIAIPDYELNPWQEPLRIDSLTFIPDERVFSANLPLPWILYPGDTIRIQLRFQPRAARRYQARLRFHFDQPCVFADTSVFLQGIGFAQPFGLQMTFADRRSTIDTTYALSCDTIRLPLYFSRPIPGTVVDVAFRLQYDTTALRLVDIGSPYLLTDSSSFPPAVYWQPLATGSQVLLKNFSAVDSIQPVAVLHFIPLLDDRFVRTVVLDSVWFDTEDVLYYQIVAGLDSHRVHVRKPDFRVLNAVDFGTVRILECSSDTVWIANAGDTVVKISELIALPPEVVVTQFQPPQQQWLQPGDTATVILQYCPRWNLSIQDTIVVYTAIPCEVHDTVVVTGAGYAPQKLHRFGFQSLAPSSWNTQVQIGDTVIVVIYSQDSLMAEYNGVRYWMNGLQFPLAVHYNPFMLRFLSAQFLRPHGRMQVANVPGQTVLQFSAMDTLSAQPLVELQYRVLVPDTMQAELWLQPGSVATDSLRFLQPQVVGDTASIEVHGKCTITYLRFDQRSTSGGIVGLTPQPASDHVVVTLVHSEKLPMTVELWDLKGEQLATFVADSQARSVGTYVLTLDVSWLPSGMYLLRYWTPNNTSSAFLLIHR